MKNKIIPFFIIGVLLLITPIAFSLEDFEVGAMGGEKRLCPTHTETINIPIENKGDETISFTVSLSGTAQKWAVAAPTGFSLEPGKTKSVYVWITPSSKALIGAYDLNIKIDGGSAGEEELSYDIIIEPCHGVEITVDDDSKTACPGELVSYELTIKNIGEYTEDFTLSLSGVAEDWAVLSQDTLRLDKNEEEEVTLGIRAPPDDLGEYGLTVTASSEDSDAVSSKDIQIVIEECYEYSIDSPKDVYSFCDHTHAKIPVLIKNEGIIDNTYDLSVTGPDWATLDDTEVFIAEGDEEVVNLTIFPDYYETGDFSIEINAESETGKVSQKKEIDITIRPCFITELKLAANQDTICAQSSKTYEVSLTNLGKFKEPYSIFIEGPEWARLDKNFVELDEGESETLSLIVDAPETVDTYNIKVIAKSQEPSETSGEDTLELEVISKDICFAIALSAELDEIDIAIGEGALIPINIENKGKEEATYSLEISGAGTSFAQLNPSTVTVEAGETDVAYLYIAIPEEAERDHYTLSVSARLEEGTIQASEAIEVNVVEVGKGVDIESVGEEEDMEEVEEEVNESEVTEDEEEGILSRITEALSSTGDKITGAFSGVTGISIIKDNWKYIVGAIIVILILILLWQGTKETPKKSNIKKKEEPEEEEEEEEAEEEPVKEEKKKKKKKKKLVKKIRELLEDEEE
ncbi:MAG: hypothetical protein JSW73_01065 [Candidatus Woesearchaeota archaeon]|nr:MAG: hypothetical protein JSW73_01065 [Candidatus Woesearchaeota archaeon]